MLKNICRMNVSPTKTIKKKIYHIIRFQGLIQIPPSFLRRAVEYLHSLVFQDPYPIGRNSFISSMTIAYRKINASKMLENCFCDECKPFSYNLIYIVIFALTCSSKAKIKKELQGWIFIKSESVKSSKKMRLKIILMGGIGSRKKFRNDKYRRYTKLHESTVDFPNFSVHSPI